VKTWLVTGGCGFIGSNLADALMGRGETVVVLDNLSRVGSQDNLQWLRSRHGSDWRFEKADIQDAGAVARLVQEERPDVLVHLAGQVAMTESIRNPRHDFEVNTLGTLNVLEAVRLHSPASIVLYSSTNKVYGSLESLHYTEGHTRYILSDYPSGLDESLPLEGHSPYGCSKLAADQYVRDYHRIYGLATVVFRHSSMYGGRQFATYDQGWIGWFCLKALEMTDERAAPFTISGNGKQVRDVLHADDLIRVYLLAVEHIERATGQVYNIGGGMESSLSLLELFTELERLSGNKMSFDLLEWRLGDQKVFVADTSRAFRDLGWDSTIRNEDGISRMLEWSRELFARGKHEGKAVL